MQNLISLWQTLDVKKRAIVAGATIAVFVAILGLAHELHGRLDLLSASRSAVSDLKRSVDAGLRPLCRTLMHAGPQPCAGGVMTG